MVTPNIYLQGDLRKATKWIPWSKQMLDKLKHLNGIVNKVYRPIPGVAIYLRSANEVDRIRIAASIVSDKCGVNFSYVATGLNVAFTSKLLNGTNGVFWDFGNNEFSVFLNPNFSYDDPGGYNVLLIGTEALFEPGLNQILLPLTSVVIEKKEGSAESPGDAYNDFLANPWTAIGTFTGMQAYYNLIYHTGSPPWWEYKARRITITVPFQNWASFDSVQKQKTLIIWRGSIFTYNKYPNTSSVKGISVSGLPGIVPRLNTSLSIPNEAIAGRVNSSIPMVETSVVLSDVDYSPLPDPVVEGLPQTGWNNVSYGLAQSVQCGAYKCTSSKTQLVTV